MNVMRSKRRGFVEKVILYLIGLLPMRCMDCRSRFFMYFGFGRSAQSR